MHPWVTKNGEFGMDECKGKIVVSDEDKKHAITSFGSVFAMAKIKLMLLRHIRRVRRTLEKAHAAAA